MNKKGIRIDSEVITLFKNDPNLFGKICLTAQKEKFMYENVDKV